MISLSIDWPPSVNHYYYHRGHHRVISERGQAFREAVCGAILREHEAFALPLYRKPLRLRVVYDCHPPDRRCRDLPNLDKAMADALSHAGLWEDDGQIDDVRFVRRPVVKGGKVVVRVEEMEPVDEPTKAIKRRATALVSSTLKDN